MVQVTVAGFVGAHVGDHLPERCVLFQLVILDCFLRRLHLLPVNEVAFVDLFEQDRIRMHGLFFEIADEPMAGRGSDHVGQKVRVEEDALGQSDNQSVNDSRISQLQEEEQVHALVLCLLKQVVDPAVVTLEGSQAPQVPLHAPDHAWNAGDGLKENQ